MNLNYLDACSPQEVPAHAKVVKSRRKTSELDAAGRSMCANLRPGHEWLRNWEYV